MSKRFLIVRSLETNDEIHRTEVTGKSERMIERVMSGMLRNMDTDRYFVVDSADEPEDDVYVDPNAKTIECSMEEIHAAIDKTDELSEAETEVLRQTCAMKR